MTRILVAESDRYSPEAAAALESLGTVEWGDLDRTALLERIETAEVLVVRLRHRIDREVLERAPRLRALVTPTTGLDHVDLEAARERDVSIVSLRGETEFLESIRATPEHTWALLLALVRRLPWAFDHVRGGGWDRDRFRGGELAGRRLGLVGLGRVGRQVARYARAFGMEVAAFDPSEAVWSRDDLPAVERRPSLDGLLDDADALSLHAPLDASTCAMIGARELARLPMGALLINTARGALLDEAAAVEALESGRLAGVAADVLAEELDASRRAESPLLERAAREDDVLITPHVAGATVESMARTELFVARRLGELLAASVPRVEARDENRGEIRGETP